MKSKTKSMISLVLCIIMIASMVISSVIAFAVQANASAATDPKAISKVIIDHRSKDAFAKTGGFIYIQNQGATEKELYHGGKTSFDASMNALKIDYFPDDTGKNGGHPYRFMSYVNKTQALTQEYKYLVIVYAAKTTKGYEMFLWNTPGGGVQTYVTKDGKDTGGKFVVSEPMDISTKNDAGISLLDRWAGGNLNALYIKSEDNAANFYIKEYGFFKSAEDARAYYAAVDLERDPTEYMSADEKGKLLKENMTNSGAGLTTVTHKEYTLEEYGLSEEVEEEFEGELPAPVIMKFGSLLEMSESGVYQTDHTGNTEGTFTFDKEVGAIKLTYSVPDSGNWAKYRMMPAFNSGNPTADHKYMRITYMTPDPMSSTITITNNVQSNSPIILVDDTSVSRGEWVTSNAVAINGAGVLQRYIDGKHCTIGYNANTETATIYIKEIAFFATSAQAYAYYGDEEVTTGSGMTVMTFGSEGTGTTVDNAGYGNYVKNDDTDTVDISYAEKTGHGVNYMVQIKFMNKELADKTHKYVRVLYSAKHPEGVNENVSMYMRNNRAGSDIIRLQKNVKDTAGEYVLSDTTLLSADMLKRFAEEGIHNSVWINSTIPGGEYSIKALYFFANKKAADTFEISTGNSDVTINNNDISKYQIVIPAGEPWQLKGAANALSSHVESISGVKLPIVTDDAPATDYEIILGLGARSEAQELYASMADKSASRYKAQLMGNKLVIVSAGHFAAADGADVLMESFLFKGKTIVPETISIDNLFDHEASSSEMSRYENWASIDNVENPDVFTDDFDTDDGYWQEENNASAWSFKDGKLGVSANTRELTYLQVYEANATVTAKLTYTRAGADGDMGLMLRYTAPDAHVRAGYDFEAGEWYIESREGNDFAPQRLASAKATLAQGTEYLLSFTADKDTAALYVNGALLLTANGITHVTPGRIAIFAEDADVTADDAEIVLLSGQGVIMRNVVHNRLPDEQYREGGSVVELTDGTLIYQHAMSTGFKSLDGGKTWTKLDSLYFNTDGTYPQVLRLNNGDLLQIRYDSSGRYATISKDDGKTWETGGRINPRYYDNSNASNLNMNDKVTQMSNGRILYVQNYNAGSADKAYKGKYQVFDAIYYSDDNGMTWKESETATFEMAGNEDKAFFAESKVIECADGTLRMYNSWNTYGCVVYSESTDNGVTWGPIVTMPELVCSRSSMQLVRDPYAENATTYYMVWVNSVPENDNGGSMTRAGLSLAKTTDGKNWDYLGDLWRWNHNYKHEGALLAHIVDPFVQCTEDAILVGTGLAEYLPVNGDGSASFHGAQRQHIWTISRETADETARPMNKFTDVALGAPYYNAVTYVSDAGLFQGTSATTFAPDTTMTRSMFVTVLGRLDGADVTKYTTPTFADVIAGQWYTSYVEWAAANGVVNGIGNGLYGIGDNVTIEQACVMLARYADNKSAASVSGKAVADFADSASVSTWAADAVKWAVENGIYSGQNGALNPQAPASRAAVADMFYNYANIFNK